MLVPKPVDHCTNRFLRKLELQIHLQDPVTTDSNMAILGPSNPLKTYRPRGPSYERFDCGLVPIRSIKRDPEKTWVTEMGP